MTELQHSISRLKAWIRDYGSEKGPVFISDLEAVLAALTPPAAEETPNDWKVPGKPDLCHHGISKWGMCGKCRAERESSPPEACPSDIAAIQAAPQCPECAETVEQVGGKWFDVAAYNSLANAIIPILEADGVHSQLLLHSAMKIADLCQSAVTAATAELQAERDAAAKELQHIAIHHIGTTYPVPANEPPLYIQNRQRMGEYEDRERELTAKVERLERTTFALASDLGRSEGRLLASEMVGVVDGWKSRAEAAESELTALRDKLAAIVGTYPQREMMLPHINAARSILNPPPGETK